MKDASAGSSRLTIMDGNEAAARVAHRVNDVIAIYPITPSSPMAESSDAWSAAGARNLWGQVPLVQEMQSEAGVAGAVHGALQAGALATTFTASQGLLLMIPNMYKIAGELTPTVFHVAARSVAAQALSIFGDHSDVMATRATGFAMLASGSVQEVGDMALIAHAATLEARIPFLHFFDGFRTSHELATVVPVTDADIRAMIDDALVEAHRARALTPDRPVIRGTSQNPDVFFQARESVNGFYDACPAIVQKAMDRLAARTGRAYHAFDYHGAPDAERVVVLIGSGAEAVHETVDALVARGEKVGLVRVRLYRPFSAALFAATIPPTATVVAALDRTKEPGAGGEPLYLDVVTALAEATTAGKIVRMPCVIGGRYGLSSKEFTPAMVKALFDEMRRPDPKNHFTLGITDDVTHASIAADASFTTEPADEVRAVFYGLGSDGTVSANKNSIRIIADATGRHAQGYFVYDSKKAGSTTVSHLRFGRSRIRSTYLVQSAHFVACHQATLLDRFDVTEKLLPGGVFLLNSSGSPEGIWNGLPAPVRSALVAKRARFHIIDAHGIAGRNGLGGRINTIMQTCFFALSNVMPTAEAIAAIKASIEKSYGKKGDELVARNFAAVDQALASLKEVAVPSADGEGDWPARPTDAAPDFVREVLAPVLYGQGDTLPVSAFPVDGTYPVGTSKWEKRGIAQEIPVWDPAVCIQCNKCAIVCPHAVIRPKIYDPTELAGKPETFKSVRTMNREWNGLAYTLQVAPEDCTGCGICVDVCPAKNKSETRRKAINMAPQAPLRDGERKNWEFFLSIPEVDRRRVNKSEVRANQLLQPLFEFSGACAGCGETPYLKLATQLFGDRMLVANATGCSSIYGGNLPTTPWAANAEGRGPAWANSLFEDNAEFGLGLRLAVDRQRAMARDLLSSMESTIGTARVRALLEADQTDEAAIAEQRERVADLKRTLAASASPEARRLLSVADHLVRRSVWIIGGDGWAYDIGFGGLDHVLASGEDVNVLVLDTEVYSNTGGQTSKSTPLGAVAKFSAGGKKTGKKDLALYAMTYGHVYVASVAMGARDEHTVRAFLEAEAHRAARPSSSPTATASRTAST